MSKFTKVMSFFLVFLGFATMGYYLAKWQAPQKKAKEAILVSLKKQSSPLALQGAALRIRINPENQVSLPRLSLVEALAHPNDKEGIHCAVIDSVGAMCENEELLEFVVTEYHLKEAPYLLSDPDWIKLTSFLIHTKKVISIPTDLQGELSVPKEIADQITRPEIKRQLGGKMSLSFYFLTQEIEGSKKALGFTEIHFAPNQMLSVGSKIIYSTP